VKGVAAIKGRIVVGCRSCCVGDVSARWPEYSETMLMVTELPRDSVRTRRSDEGDQNPRFDEREGIYTTGQANQGVYQQSRHDGYPQSRGPSPDDIQIWLGEVNAVFSGNSLAVSLPTGRLPGCKQLSGVEGSMQTAQLCDTHITFLAVVTYSTLAR
jgi:hypothetical protein